MSRPKVASRTIGYQSRVKRIEKILMEHPEGLAPKVIAYILSINQSTIKSILPKMKNVKKKEGFRGIYVLDDRTTHVKIFDWNFHNVHLSYIPKGDTEKRISKTERLELFNFKFEIGEKSKKATLHLGSNHPMNMPALDLVVYLFKTLIRQSTNEEAQNDEIYISCMEFNQDYANLRLDGINSVAYDTLWTHFKVYQKENCVRKEYKTKTPFNVESLFDMLQAGENTQETYNQLREIKDQLAKIVKDQRNLANYIFKEPKQKRTNKLKEEVKEEDLL